MSDLAPRPNDNDTWTVYGASSWCNSCRRVKAFLTSKGEEYVYHELGNDIPKVKELVKSFEDITNGNTKIPMVFHKGKYIEGGCAGTIEYYKTLDN